MKIKCLLYISLFLYFSCKSKNEICLDLKGYKKFEVKDERISVILIKSYENEKKCQTGVKNANVYLCQVAETNDTILIFEPCSKMPKFAKNNYEGERDLILERKDILNDNFQMFNIIIDDSTLIKKKYYYTVGSLTYLIY
jgi:hypothetical protein